MYANRETIRSLYEAFARGDAAAVLGAFDPDIVWLEGEHTPYAAGNPYRGPQRVAEGVLAPLAIEWDHFTVVPEVLLQDGEVVVALGRYRATFKATGRRIDAQFVHVWTVREGLVTHFQGYADTTQFSRAAVALPAGVAAVAPRASATSIAGSAAPAA